MPDRTGQRGAKLWSGRLGDATSPAVERYTASLAIDRRLYAEDIQASQAHARMLHSIGVLDAAQHAAIDSGLHAIADEMERGQFIASEHDEDVHSAVERRLHELIGLTAGMLHSGRSRNDQVATDMRLHVMRSLRALVLAVTALQAELLRRAAEHRDTLLPGYTHGQRAQLVSLAHHLLAYVEMLERDAGRLLDAHARCDVLPLGSGALAGSTLPLDREQVAGDLGFAAVSGNSIDAVSDRDFAVETASACALLMVHLSRLGEELALWSTAEFGFVEFPDTHATGSSLMPQKKNPDVAELARGRTGRVIGDLVALLTMLKGLPLAYNRDLQEDKPATFDALDTAAETVTILTELVSVVRFNVDAMSAAAADPGLLATDVAEYLVLRGVPFREAHTIVGALVRQTAQDGRAINDLSIDEWRAASDAFDEGVLDVFDRKHALRRRDLPGGPGPHSVARQLARGAERIERTRARVAELSRR
jgi:argininosuccinate lyase